jgi:hypothetical protein
LNEVSATAHGGHPGEFAARHTIDLSGWLTPSVGSKVSCSRRTVKRMSPVHVSAPTVKRTVKGTAAVASAISSRFSSSCLGVLQWSAISILVLTSKAFLPSKAQHMKCGCGSVAISLLSPAFSPIQIWVFLAQFISFYSRHVSFSFYYSCEIISVAISTGGCVLRLAQHPARHYL